MCFVTLAYAIDRKLNFDEMKYKRHCETVADTSCFEGCLPSTKPALHSAVNVLSHALHKRSTEFVDIRREEVHERTLMWSFRLISELTFCFSSFRSTFVYLNSEHTLLCTSFQSINLVYLISGHICVGCFISEHTFLCTSFRSTHFGLPNFGAHLYAWFRSTPFCARF